MKDEDSESKSLKVKRQVWTRRTDRKRKRTQAMAVQRGQPSEEFLQIW